MAILGTVLLILVGIAVHVGGARLPARCSLGTVRREPERARPAPPPDPPEAA